MRLAFVPSVLTAVLMTGSAVLAAPATPEQAQTIKTALERYLGNGGGGDMSPVQVTPEGDRYTVDVDVKKLLHAVEPFGVTVEPATYHTILQPQEDGTWRVTNEGSSRFSAKYGDRTVSLIMNGTKFDGVFDPAIPSYRSSKSSFDNITIAALGEDGEAQTRDTRKGTIVLGTEPAGDGMITAHRVQTSAQSVQQVTIAGPKETPERNANVLSGSTVDETHVEALRVRALLDLWAFFVAHPSAEAIKAEQEQLRSLMRQALPLFQHLSQSTSVELTTVESMIGTFEAKSASLRLDMNGLLEDGRIGSALKMGEFKIPSGLVPAWVEALLPSRVELAETLSGFHLETLSQKAVDSFNLNGKDPFTPEALDQLRPLIGPLDQMVLTIAPSRFVGALLDARIEGRVRLRQPVPELALKIAVSGLDAAIKDVQAKGGDDDKAKQLIAVALLAKGFGKAEPDGSMSWDVTSDASGGVLINGVALPFGHGK